jgi:threonylcarbamoyladenosine tRNA methylthiotransferase MtaB
MKRRHSRGDAIAFCERARSLRPDVVFGADLIAGFPTETDEMFENSRKIIDECGLTYLHVFPFSPRHGTPAARMPQVPGPIVKQRAAELRAKGGAVLAAYLSEQQGRVVDVLVEADGKGRTPQFAEVDFRRDDAVAAVAGRIIPTRIVGAGPTRLTGEVQA